MTEPARAVAAPRKSSWADGSFHELLKVLNENGITEVGISSGADDLADETCKIPISQDEKVTSGMLFQSVPLGEGASEAIKTLVMAALALLHRHRTLIERGLARQYDGVTRNSGPPEDFVYQDALNRLTVIVYACKVQWWQTNHHTGTSRTKSAGYLKKVMESQGLRSEHATDVSAVHMIAHWFDTRAILWSAGALGTDRSRIKHISPEDLKVLPTVSNDILIRLFANPAGTAKQCDVATVIKTLISTHYVRVMHEGLAPAAVELIRWVRHASRDWAVYHMGAKYLTGQDRVMPLEVNPMLGRVARSFVNYTMEGSSMARSQALRSFDEDPDFLMAAPAIKRAFKEKELDIKASLMSVPFYAHVTAALAEERPGTTGESDAH